MNTYSAYCLGADQELTSMGGLDELLLFHFRRAMRRTMSKLSVDAGGVAPIERFFALSLIAANPGISQARLAQELVCDKSSMTRLLKKLSDHGLISRMTDLTDRRCFVLFPTETGFIELGLLRASISTLDRSIRTLAGDVEFGRICQALEVLASLCR